MSDATLSPRASIERHSKSFALASRLLPPRVADRAALVYAWCRRADDAIDEASAETPEGALSRLRGELVALYDGAAPDDPVLRAFGSVLRETDIPWAYPAGLLDGMTMDVTGHRYERLEDVLVYSYRVASTVGLMMCHVMGVSDAAALRHAAHLGLAMQLTNICRDVNEDWQRGRLYLPEELLARHGASGLAAELGGALPATAVEACRRTLVELLDIADGYYRSSDAGLPYLSWRCALGVNAARRIYAAIGGQLARRRWNVLAPRAVVPKAHKLWLCAEAAASTLARAVFAPAQRFEAVPLHTVRHGAELISL
ncbi:MAG TPA: phytoene/squalene synthase family protein [Polyangiaceae bacterium]|nr:phytoene/squalene synthase family protein [Polyangiaceae bacterium]